LHDVFDRYTAETPLVSPHPPHADWSDVPWPPRDYAAPLGTAVGGRLSIAPGASRITIAGNPGSTDLWRAHFAGEVPQIDLHPDGVTLRYRRHSLIAWVNDLIGDDVTAAMLELAGQVPWRIEVNGGVSQCSAYLGDIRLETLRVAGGASQLDVSLSRPVGVVPIQIGGGASQVTICRPREVAARLRVAGGATHLDFDGHQFGAVGGEIRWQTSGADSAADRYEIDVAGGASMFTLTTR
jgi:hypothetical protein